MPENVLSKLTEEEKIKPWELANPAPTRSSKSNYLIYDAHCMNEKKVHAIKHPKKRRKSYPSDFSDTEDFSAISHYGGKSRLVKRKGSFSSSSCNSEEEEVEQSTVPVTPDESHKRIATLLKIGQSDEFYDKAGSTDEEMLSMSDQISCMEGLLLLSASETLESEAEERTVENLTALKHLAHESSVDDLAAAKERHDSQSRNALIKNEERPYRAANYFGRQGSGAGGDYDLGDINNAILGPDDETQLQSSSENLSDHSDSLPTRKSLRTAVVATTATMPIATALPSIEQSQVERRSNLPVASPLLRGDINIERERHERALLNQLPLKGQVDELPQITQYNMQSYRDIDSDGVTQIILDDDDLVDSEEERLEKGGEEEAVFQLEKHRASSPPTFTKLPFIKKVETLLPKDVDFTQAAADLAKESEKIVKKAEREREALLTHHVVAVQKRHYQSNKNLGNLPTPDATKFVLDRLRWTALPTISNYTPSGNLKIAKSASRTSLATSTTTSGTYTSAFSTSGQSQSQNKIARHEPSLFFLSGYDSSHLSGASDDSSGLRDKRRRLEEIKKEYASIVSHVN
jgi:hypothetical protein